MSKQTNTKNRVTYQSEMINPLFSICICDVIQKEQKWYACRKKRYTSILLLHSYFKGKQMPKMFSRPKITFLNIIAFMWALFLLHNVFLWQYICNIYGNNTLLFFSPCCSKFGVNHLILFEMNRIIVSLIPFHFRLPVNPCCFRHSRLRSGPTSLPLRHSASVVESFWLPS